MGQADAFQDDLLRHLNGTGFHHHNGVAVAGDDHVEQRGVAALEAGVNLVAAAVPGDPAGADGAVKGDVADGKRGGSGHHAQGFGGVVFVHGEDGDDDLDFVVQALGKEGADAAVGETGREDGLGAGAPLAAEEAAGDFADGVEALFELHGQGQEVDAFAGLVGHYHGGQEDGFAAGDGYGAVGLLGQASGFKGYGLPADFAGDGEGVHQFAGGVSSGHESKVSYLVFQWCCCPAAHHSLRRGRLSGELLASVLPLTVARNVGSPGRRDAGMAM